jgi:hypothetical protein
VRRNGLSAISAHCRDGFDSGLFVFVSPNISQKEMKPMTTVLEQLNPQIHVRFAGRSLRLNAGALDIGSLSSDREIKSALARHFGVGQAMFASHVVERHDNGHFTVRPEAVFG